MVLDMGLVEQNSAMHSLETQSYGSAISALVSGKFESARGICAIASEFSVMQW
jgi:hypothetical protein